MPIGITNITTLKTVAADAKKLRFVEEKQAWYYADPTSSSTGDDDNIVLPNAGVGRWLKAAAKNANSNLIWQIQTSNVNAIAGYGYMVDATSAAVTITLPSSPSVGDTVAVILLSATSLVNKATIARNGKNILGQTLDRQLTTQGHIAYFIYTNSTYGWAIESDSSVGQSRSAVSRVFSSFGDTNGIVNYLGTQLGTVTFQNPTSNASSRLVRLWGEAGNASAANLFDRTYTQDNIFNAVSNDGCLIWGFEERGTGNNPAQVQMTDLFMEINSAEFPTDFSVYGSNSTYPSYSGSFTTQLFANFSWDKLQTFRNVDTLTWTTNGTYRRYLFNINSPNYYKYYAILLARSTTVSQQRIRMSELDFYGNIIT